ncbi:nucleotide pyrophosphohydrolase, partial [Streptococcus pneumoniae]
SQLSKSRLTRTIFEKDKTAAVNYQHKHDLEGFLKGK